LVGRGFLFTSTSRPCSQSLETNQKPTFLLESFNKRWATKKASGSTKNGRTSSPKYWGVRKFGGQSVVPGDLIVHQKGSTFHPGRGVRENKIHSLIASVPGFVRFSEIKLNGYKNIKKYVHVETPEMYENIAKIKAHTLARRSHKWRGKIRPEWVPNVSKEEQFLTKVKGEELPPQLTFKPKYPKVLAATNRFLEKKKNALLLNRLARKKARKLLKAEDQALLEASQKKQQQQQQQTVQ